MTWDAFHRSGRAAAGWSAAQWVPRKRRTRRRTWDDRNTSTRHPEKEIVWQWLGHVGPSHFKHLQTFHILTMLGAFGNPGLKSQMVRLASWEPVPEAAKAHPGGDTQSYKFLGAGSWARLQVWNLLGRVWRHCWSPTCFWGSLLQQPFNIRNFKVNL